MTEPGGGHIDLDRLAEHDEGLLPDVEAAAAESHLADCRACREQLAAVRTTRALLSSLPDEPMPAAVAARLDEALAGAAATATVVPMLSPRTTRWFNRPTGAGLAAAAVVAALVGAVVVGASVKGDGGDDAGTAALNKTTVPELAPPAYPVLATGVTYTEANAATRGKDLERLADAAADAAELATDGIGPTTASGVGQVVAPGDIPAATRAMFVSPEELLTCVAKLTAGGPQVLPIAVDFVRWKDPGHHPRGVPAVAIVLPQQVKDSDGVFVVGPECATSPTQDIYVFAKVS